MLVTSCVFLLLVFPVVCYEIQIRWTGVGLQLIGFVSVVWGLLKGRTASGKPTLRSNLRNWLERRPRFRTKIIAAAAKAAGIAAPVVELAVSIAHLMARRSGGSTSCRKSWMMLSTRSWTSSMGGSGARAGAFRQHAAERGQREAELQRLQREFDDAVFGGLSLDMAGVIYFGLGTVVWNIA